MYSDHFSINVVFLRNIITTLILIFAMTVGATRWSPCPA